MNTRSSVKNNKVEQSGASSIFRQCARCGAFVAPGELKFDQSVGAVCVNCYKELTEGKRLKTEKQKRYKLLFEDAVKKHFKMDEIPDWWLEQVEKMMGRDPKLDYVWVYSVFKYAVGVVGYEPDPMFGLSFLVRYVEPAKEYYKKQKEIREHNQNAVIENKTVTVVIKKPRVTKKPKTKIEEL